MRDQDCSTSSESSALDCRGSVLVQTVGTKDARWRRQRRPMSFLLSLLVLFTLAVPVGALALRPKRTWDPQGKVRRH
jgi:hypothetical protein